MEELTINELELKILCNQAIQILVMEDSLLQSQMQNSDLRDFKNTLILRLSDAIGWNSTRNFPNHIIDTLIDDKYEPTKKISEVEFFNTINTRKEMSGDTTPDYFYELMHELRNEGNVSSILDLDGISLWNAYLASNVGNEIVIDTTSIENELKFRIYKYVFKKTNWSIHYHSSTLSSSFKDEKDQLRLFDKVLSTPAINNKTKLNLNEIENDQYKRFDKFEFSTSDISSFQIIQAHSNLSPRGVSFILTNGSPLLQTGKTEKIRRDLIQKDQIEGVIELASGLLPQSAVPSYLLILNNKKPPELKEKVKFFSASHIFDKTSRLRTLEPESIHEIANQYNGDYDNEYIKILDHKTISQNQYSLLPGRYFKKYDVNLPGSNFEVIEEDKYSSLPKIHLNELCTVMAGYNPRKTLSKTYPIQLINAASINNYGIVDFTTADLISAPISRSVDRARVRKSDILVVSRGHNIKLAIIRSEPDIPVYASNNLLILRPYDAEVAYFIYAFLESPFGKMELDNIKKGTTIPMVTANDLGSIELPQLSTKLQKEIATTYRNTSYIYQEKLQIAEKEFNEKKIEFYSKMGLIETY